MAANWLARHWVTVTVVVGGLGAALVAAAQLGVALTPLAMLLVVLLLWTGRKFAAVGWWVNRRRRVLAKASLPAPSTRVMLADWRIEKARVRQIRKQWPAFCDVNNYRGLGKVVPSLRRFRSTIAGDVVCHVSPGPIAVKGGVDKLVSLSSDLREVVGIGCTEVLVRRAGTGHATIIFLWTEAMERVLPVAELPTARKGEIAYGTRRDGTVASIRMSEPTLCGGLTGSGKSSVAWALFADLNRQDGLRYELYVSNLKGGAELKAFAGKTGQQQGPLMVAAYAADVAGTIRIIAKFEEDMKEVAKTNPYRQWTPDHCDEYPLRILILDESVELMMKMDTKQRATLDTCLSQGRANGFMVIMLSQLGQVEILKQTRNYIPQRLSLAQRDAINTNMFLGDGADQGGAPCSQIVNRPGLGYSYDERRRGYELFRSAWVDDDDMERIACGLLPDGMGEGIGKAPVNRQCAIYYFFTAAGASLYVGISVDPVRRRNEHAGLAGKPAKWWWEHVDESKTVINWADSEAAALVVEGRDIARFQPVGNKQHNTTNRNAGRVPAALPALRSRWSRKPAPIAEPQPGNVTPIRRKSRAERVLGDDERKQA